MDERFEKAFEVANYMATLSNQRRILLTEFEQKLIYYINGATFKITPDLINFTKTMIDMGYINECAFVDSNNLPVVISDVSEFFNDICSIYFESVNAYSVKYSELATKRRIKDIVEL